MRFPNFNSKVIVILLIVLGLVVYFNTIQHPFVHDDLVFIKQNKNINNFGDLDAVFLPLRQSRHLRSGLAGITPARGVSHKSSESEAFFLINPYYRPVLELVYKLQFKFFGSSPYWYHFFNILMHILNSILVFAVTVSVTKRMGLSLCVALIFLVHPVQSEAVACISGISNLMFVCFGLMSFLLYVRHRSSETVKKARLFPPLLSLVFFVIALLAKEQALVFLGLIVLYECCFFQKIEHSNKSRLFHVGAFILVACVYLLWRKLVLGVAVAEVFKYQGELFLRIASIPRTILMYVRLLIFPYDLHYYRSIDILDNSVYYAVLLLIFLFIVFGVLRKTKGEDATFMSFGAGWFLITLIPVLNIIPLIHEYSIIAAFEHFLYLPLVGFLIFISVFLSRLLNPNFALELNDRRETLQEKDSNANRLRRGLTPIVATSCDVSALRADFANTKSGLKEKKGVGVVIITIVTFVCSVLTVRQNMFWRSEVALFERTITFEKRIGRVYALLGKAYYFEENYDEAIKGLSKAADIFSGYIEAVEDSRVSAFYKKLLKSVYFDLAHCYEKKGIISQAVLFYENILKIDAEDINVYNNIGVIYARSGDFGNAIRYFDKSIELDPGNLMAKSNLAICYIEKDEIENGERLLEEVLSENSNFEPAKTNLERLRLNVQ